MHELVFTGNPLHEKFLEDNDGKQEIWQAEVQKRLKPLRKLDGKRRVRETMGQTLCFLFYPQVSIVFVNKKEEIRRRAGTMRMMMERKDLTFKSLFSVLFCLRYLNE